jgi:hypothetical protein
VRRRSLTWTSARGGGRARRVLTERFTLLQDGICVCQNAVHFLKARRSRNDLVKYCVLGVSFGTICYNESMDAQGWVRIWPPEFRLRHVMLLLYQLKDDYSIECTFKANRVAVNGFLSLDRQILDHDASWTEA